MSNERKVTIKICRRAAYLMFRNPTRSLEALDAREFISRCYEIS